MSGKPSPTAVNKLVSDKCDEYQKNIRALLKQEFRSFSVQLPTDLNLKIDKIKKSANSNQIGIEGKERSLFSDFQEMHEYVKERINRILILQVQPPLSAEAVKSLDEMSIRVFLDLEAALNVQKETYARSKETTVSQIPLRSIYSPQNSTTPTDRGLQDRQQSELDAQATEIKRLTEELQGLRVRLAEAETATNQARTDGDVSRKSLYTAVAQNDELKQQLLAAKGEVGEANRMASEANASAAAAGKTASEAQQQARGLQQRLDSQEVTLLQANSDNKTLEGQLLAENARANQEKERADQANATAEQAKSGFSGLQTQITQLQQQLDSQKQALLAEGAISNAGLQSQIDLLKQELQQTQEESQEKTAKLQAQGKLLESATVQNQILSGENGTLSASNTQLVSENGILKKQLEEAASQSLASRQALTDGLGSQDEIFKKLQAQLKEAEAKVTAADARVLKAEARATTAVEKQTAELMKQLGEQEDELTHLRKTNGNLQQRLGDLASQLTEKDRVLVEKANLLATRGIELQALPEDRDRAEKQQLSTIGLQREEIEQLKAKVAGLEEAQGVSATDKAEFDKLQALVKKQEEQIVKLTSENTEGIQARTVLSAENDELKKRNLELDPLKTKIGRLIADNAALRARVASLEAENERLNKQSTESEKKQQDQLDRLQLSESENAKIIKEKRDLAEQNGVLNLENSGLKNLQSEIAELRLASDKRADTAEGANTDLQRQLKDLTEKLAIANVEKEELTARNLELTTEQDGRFDSLMLSNSGLSQIIVELEKKLLELQEKNEKLQLSRTSPESVPATDPPSIKQVHPAIGTAPAKDDKLKKVELPTEAPRPMSAPADLGVGRLARFASSYTLAAQQAEQQATGKESGSMLKHNYEPDDSSVKSSSYDPKNTENKFKNDGGEEVAALLAGSKTIVLEGDPPQKMRYTKDLDQKETILAGALTLEGISESQPKGVLAVQATMEDCDNHPEFILAVLMKFHERLNAKLKSDLAVHCTTIDYKGDNLMIRDLINLHNKVAKEMNSANKLETKKLQSQQMLEQLVAKKDIALKAPPADLRKKVSDQNSNRSKRSMR